MELGWYHSGAVGERPPEVDTHSSPVVIYQRKDFTSAQDDNGNTVWEYMERKLTPTEYADVRVSELEAVIDALIGGEPDV